MNLEWLIVSDYAQVVGGKLYLMGGGWDVLTVNQPLPMAQYLGVAASFKVGWNETNELHNLEIEFANERGEGLAKIGGMLEVGRPPGIPRGQDQRAQLAGNLFVQIAELGTYRITARIEGQDQGSITFTVVPGPLFSAAGPTT
jgi:hypothetical protein